MDIQPKDPSRGHFYVSMGKSVLRLFAGGCLAYGLLVPRKKSTYKREQQ